MEDEKILTTTYDPHTEDNNERWVFPDSQFLPLPEVKFCGQVEKRSKAGSSKIPCLKFENGEVKYYLSLWSKPLIPLPLASGDSVRLYINKNSKLEVLNLSNPQFS